MGAPNGTVRCRELQSHLRKEQYDEMVLRVGFPPTPSTFEASHSDNLSYGSCWRRAFIGADGETCTLAGQCLAVYKTAAVAAEPHRQNGGLPRIRTVFSPVKSRDFTVKVCNPAAPRWTTSPSGHIIQTSTRTLTPCLPRRSQRRLSVCATLPTNAPAFAVSDAGTGFVTAQPKAGSSVIGIRSSGSVRW
jgi:hypothetical protein